MARRQKAAAAAYPVPQTIEECARDIARIGEDQREIADTERLMNEDIAAIKDSCELDAQPFRAELKALLKGVQTYCEANRTELTKGGQRKTVKLSSGSIAWRARPPKVNLRGVEAVIERLGVGRLKEPKVAATIDGVSITAGEDFVITPFGATIDGDGA